MTGPRQFYSLIDHTADIGMEVRGIEFHALLEQAGKGLFHVVTDISTVRPTSRIHIGTWEGNEEHIMRSWLEKLLFHFNTDDILFARFSVTPSDDGGFAGAAWGEVFDSQRHTIHTEIKGITYHQFEVSQSKDGWYARIIFDV